MVSLPKILKAVSYEMSPGREYSQWAQESKVWMSFSFLPYFNSDLKPESGKEDKKQINETSEFQLRLK